MNEAYLNLGFPIILRKDEFKEMWFYYFHRCRGDYKSYQVAANSPNEAIEAMNTIGLTPIAMHFYEDYHEVILYFILKH
jgi:hypothetical protein